MKKTLHKALLAAAAWTDLEAAIKNMEAATLRGDDKGAAEFRGKAHELLDTHLDLKTENMAEVRETSKRLNR